MRLKIISARLFAAYLYYPTVYHYLLVYHFNIQIWATFRYSLQVLQIAICSCLTFDEQ